MEITSIVVQGRDQALLYGDYSTYHSQLAKRLLNSRKKLGIATKNRGKFQKKKDVTPEDVAGNHEYVRLLLLASERAWAQAMSIKSAHTTGQKGMSSRARSHIVSRLGRAAATAQQLLDILSQRQVSGASSTDVLEARAYASLIRGSMQFEKHAWEPCVEHYAVARVIYGALSTAGQEQVFKDLLSDTIDPSIRYAAYQLRTPRTVPIPTIARQAFPRADGDLVREINELDGSLLAEADDMSKAGSTADGAPKTLTWRERQVQIEDAQISLAWASVGEAKSRLTQALAKAKEMHPYKVAAAYDEILTATQDAVDATKQAIDELKGEGVAQSDARMQRLQITRTAVNYEMISWRIGRNRVLTGRDDGAPDEYGSLRRKKRRNPAPSDEAEAGKERERDLPRSKKLAKLKEKVALYDGTLQNLQSVKELPGVAADEGLATKLDAFDKYFASLKALSIGRSHAIVGQFVNALALIDYAFKLCEGAASRLVGSDDDADELPLSMDVSPNAVNSLGTLLRGELQRHRAIVHLNNLRQEEKDSNKSERLASVPLIERLHEYPAHGVDFTNLVELPPKPRLIPVKPIFLDVAWNYIDYPGKSGASSPAATSEHTPPPKRGWFGFGRS
ncbi:Signal recognition particle 68 kDa protein [Drechmeria coniospora]|uniref:Signal recognition particle subunit SRP68 n=1 Tax=Drechmeria coniospora TaxID=98403 RepID=A0A151GQS5_DRECN|nr:Signal recognition particle 68 kDa protein [Drechmeria coniospora]KYK59418.1 Signal recognition particle 68 kDa protein [Drechmeria coniospora]ODA76341.1 hypothetical protein RJ55_08187 [Drechmeria coniospora]